MCTKEMTAMRRLSKYLKERYPRIKSCRELEREIIEEYLTYLKTEATETKAFSCRYKQAPSSFRKHR